MIFHSEDNKQTCELCITPIGGLGNRLLVISSGLRFLNKGYYNKLRINWVNTFEIGVNMNEIISIEGNVYEAPPFHDTKSLPLGTLPDVRIPLLEKLNISHFSSFRSLNDNYQDDLTPEWKIAIQQIKYVSFLTSIADTIDVSDRIGIHCRRSDYWTLNHETAARTYIKLDRAFISYIEKTYPDEKFFIATDSPFTLINFEESLKDKLIHYPKSSYPMWRTRDSNCIRDSIIDHILLSRCKKIIADSSSTFSQTAAWMGNKDKERWVLPLK